MKFIDSQNDSDSEILISQLERPAYQPPDHKHFHDEDDDSITSPRPCCGG